MANHHCPLPRRASDNRASTQALFDLASCSASFSVSRSLLPSPLCGSCRKHRTIKKKVWCAALNRLVGFTSHFSRFEISHSKTKFLASKRSRCSTPAHTSPSPTLFPILLCTPVFNFLETNLVSQGLKPKKSEIAPPLFWAKQWLKNWYSISNPSKHVAL